MTRATRPSKAFPAMRRSALTAIARWDAGVSAVASRANRGAAARLMFVGGAPGAEVAFVPAGAIVAVWALYARGPRAALAMAAATALTFAINRLLKWIIPRRRPHGALSREPSFPSGHAMAGVAVYGTAIDIAGRFSPGLHPLIMAAALSLGLSIGFTRIARKQHWPSDVAAGLALGLAIFGAAAAFARP